mmetsp:Transcript_11582/g.25892  ORF Transcript_11582/g.25892 Transcript_11582/m.25892 type:complete len:263 (+) Transcript_11582:111-899(+)
MESTTSLTAAGIMAFASRTWLLSVCTMLIELNKSTHQGHYHYDQHNGHNNNNPELFLSDPLLIPNGVDYFFVGSLNVVVGALYIVFNLIQQGALLLRQQSKVQKHLMQFVQRPFQRHQVVLTFLNGMILGLDLLRWLATCHHQNTTLIQGFHSVLQGVLDFVLRHFGLDNANLTFDLVGHIALVLLLGGLVLFHVILKLVGHGTEHVLTHSHIRSILSFRGSPLQVLQVRFGFHGLLIPVFQQIHKVRLVVHLRSSGSIGAI